MLDPGPFTAALLILLVIMIFNLIIFVHELGHFWAAKWRGLKIDRFQIWFGKPIWSKTINGVQYGLGWIPAGGFVALPQMAPMEAIEGGNLESGDPLPAITPLDKIIVAFAGPFFSFLLAFVSAVIIWLIAKPVDVIPTTTIGWVEAGSKAEEAGLKRGDRILYINEQPVESWNLPLDSVFMHIATSKGDRIHFTVDRPGEGQMEIVSDFYIPPSESVLDRKKTRQVGIMPMAPDTPIAITGLIEDPNAPARLAGLEEGDVVKQVDGEAIVDFSQLLELIKNSEGKALTFKIERDGAPVELAVSPVRPIVKNAEPDAEPQAFMIGAMFSAPDPYIREWRKPNPIQQTTDTLRTMWITLTSVASPKSSIGIQHLSGPVGIGKIQYFSLLLDHPFHRILGFMVLININLALLNLLPFPVLDGGHITIATMEAIARRPVNVKFLEVLQLGFVFLLFSIMLYVTSKDIFDDFGMGGNERPETVFPAPEGG